MRDPADTETKRRGRRGPTVADVARLAGVSPMTVSRVVNSEANVLAATRDRVTAAIAELGYVQNQAARSLAGGRQFRIALLHSNPSAAYLSEFLVGSLSEASRRNAQLLVEHCDDDATPALLVARLRTHRVDAVLLPPPLSDRADLLDALHAAGLPMAQIATGSMRDFAVAVSIDDEAAAHMLTARLLALGHRRIGFISGDTNQSASILRQAGYRRALADASIAVEERWLAQGDFTYRSGLAAANGLLTGRPPPTAIFASNDDMAAATVAAAHRLGLDVPGDVSVCGFDDTALATTIWPELTTVRQPIAEMARLGTGALIETLAARLSGAADMPAHHRLAFTLVERASAAAPGPDA